MDGSKLDESRQKLNFKHFRDKILHDVNFHLGDETTAAAENTTMSESKEAEFINDSKEQRALNIMQSSKSNIPMVTVKNDQLYRQEGTYHSIFSHKNTSLDQEESKEKHELYKLFQKSQLEHHHKDLGDNVAEMKRFEREKRQFRSVGKKESAAAHHEMISNRFKQQGSNFYTNAHLSPAEPDEHFKVTQQKQIRFLSSPENNFNPSFAQTERHNL